MWRLFLKEPANSYRYSFFDIAAVSAKADLLYQRKRPVLPQITQMTQSNAAGCIISQRKTVWNVVVLGFICVNLRDLRETHGVSLCNVD